MASRGQHYATGCVDLRIHFGVRGCLAYAEMTVVPGASLAEAEAVATLLRQLADDVVAEVR